MNPIFLASVIKGKLMFNNPDSFDKYLQVLNNKSVDVVVRLPRKDRSNQQNRYLWGVCYKLISETTGYTYEEVHDAMRMLFLTDHTRDIPTLRSTTQLTTVEFISYTDQIKQWAAEHLNCVIPDPETVEV